MNRVMMKITRNQKIAEKTYFMSLEGDTSAITAGTVRKYKA